jgi:hypothetical protein
MAVAWDERRRSLADPLGARVLDVAEERITTKFAGLVIADPTPEDRRRSLDEPLAG